MWDRIFIWKGRSLKSKHLDNFFQYVFHDLRRLQTNMNNERSWVPNWLPTWMRNRALADLLWFRVAFWGAWFFLINELSLLIPPDPPRISIYHYSFIPNSCPIHSQTPKFHFLDPPPPPIRGTFHLLDKKTDTLMKFRSAKSLPQIAKLHKQMRTLPTGQDFGGGPAEWAGAQGRGL